MNIDSYDILVIFLSVTLAIFLVLTIVLMIYLVKVIKDIREITKKAGSVVDSIETVGKAAATKKSASFIGSVIAAVVKSSIKGNQKKDKKNE